jgi:hypothetical protein
MTVHAVTLEAQAALGRLLLHAVHHPRGAQVAHELVDRLHYLAKWATGSVATLMPEAFAEEGQIAVWMEVDGQQPEGPRYQWRGGLVVHADGTVAVHT